MLFGLVGPSLLLTASAAPYQIVREGFCSLDSKPECLKMFKPYKKKKQTCQHLCDEDPNCTAFEMACGNQCILMSSCGELRQSNCHSYVHVQTANASAESLVVTQSTIDWQVLGIVLASVLPSFAGLIYLQRSYVFADYKVFLSLAPEGPLESDHLQTEMDLRYGRIADFVLKFLVLPLALLGVGSAWYPLFPPSVGEERGGMCGLAHSDLSPIWYLYPGERNADANLLLDGAAYPVPALDAMPRSCWYVLLEDVVTDATGPSCEAWCRTYVTGGFPRPLCEFLPLTGIMFRVCSKVTVWSWLKHGFAAYWTPSLAAAIYSCLSLWWAREKWQRQHDRQNLPAERGKISGPTALVAAVQRQHNRGRSCSRASPPEREATARLSEAGAEAEGPRSGASRFDVMLGDTSKLREPEARKVRKDGPFASGWLQMPMCCLPAWNDRCASRVHLAAIIFGTMLDPLNDVNLSVLFLVRGEVFYSAIMAFSILLPNLHDPMQSEFVVASWMSWKQGFPIKEVYRIMWREGKSEGVLSLIVAVIALMRIGYFRPTHFLRMAPSMLTAVASSVVVSIPHAASAWSLFVDSSTVFEDYYDVARRRAEVKVIKWLPVLDAFALAVACGRTFPNPMRLAMVLWMMGAIVGSAASVCLFAGSRMGSSSYRLEGRHLATLVIAFLSWPVGATRLTAVPAAWDNMCTGSRFWPGRCQYGEGDEPPLLVDACFFGCASTPPAVYYTHRVLTLTGFWAYTVLTNEYSFYLQLAKDVPEAFRQPFWMMIQNGRLWVAGFILSGWLALMAEAVGFCILRKDLAVSYGISGKTDDGDGYAPPEQNPQLPE